MNSRLVIACVVCLLVGAALARRPPQGAENGDGERPDRDGGRRRGNGLNGGVRVCTGELRLPGRLCAAKYLDGTDYPLENSVECRVPEGSDVDPADLCDTEGDGKIALDSAGVAVRVFKCSRVNRDGEITDPSVDRRASRGISEENACQVVGLDGVVSQGGATCEESQACADGPKSILDDEGNVVGAGYKCCRVLTEEEQAAIEARRAEQAANREAAAAERAARREEAAAERAARREEADAAGAARDEEAAAVRAAGGENDDAAGAARRQDGAARREDGGARREDGGARREDGGARREDGGARREDGSARRQ